jgi:hypothetical protein
VAEGARLESVCTRKGTQGSNPCLSAISFPESTQESYLLLQPPAYPHRDHGNVVLVCHSPAFHRLLFLGSTARTRRDVSRSLCGDGNGHRFRLRLNAPGRDAEQHYQSKAGCCCTRCIQSHHRQLFRGFRIVPRLCRAFSHAPRRQEGGISRANSSTFFPGVG